MIYNGFNGAGAISGQDQTQMTSRTMARRRREQLGPWRETGRDMRKAWRRPQGPTPLRPRMSRAPRPPSARNSSSPWSALLHATPPVPIMRRKLGAGTADPAYHLTPFEEIQP